ncbi:MAG: quinol oxidase [Edaphobacter sp.]|nr:quinol oxidase [Edaphobacter sp.]
MNVSKRACSVSFLLCLTLTSWHLRAEDTPRTIEVHAKRYSFSPGEITIKKGERVTLILTTDDVAHSLVIRGLNLKKEIAKGHPVRTVISSDREGDFAGQCGRFCGSGHGLMKFIVHVTDK